MHIRCKYYIDQIHTNRDQKLNHRALILSTTSFYHLTFYQLTQTTTSASFCGPSHHRITSPPNTKPTQKLKSTPIDYSRSWIPSGCYTPQGHFRREPGHLGQQLYIGSLVIFPYNSPWKKSSLYIFLSPSFFFFFTSLFSLALWVSKQIQFSLLFSTVTNQCTHTGHSRSRTISLSRCFFNLCLREKGTFPRSWTTVSNVKSFIIIWQACLKLFLNSVSPLLVFSHDERKALTIFYF